MSDRWVLVYFYWSGVIGHVAVAVFLLALLVSVKENRDEDDS